MEAIASCSSSRPVSNCRAVLKSCDLPAAIDEELANESDSSDASWMADFAQESDKEQSDCSDDEVTIAGTQNQPSTSKKGGEPLKWTSNLNFKPLEQFSSPTGVSHNLMPGSEEKDYFSLFIDYSFCELVSNETNKYARHCQEQKSDPKWEDTFPREIEAYFGILIYMGIVDLPEIRDYFIGDFCICPIVQQAMTLRRFEKISQYLHLNDENEKKVPDFLFKARPALDVTKKFGQYYKPGCDLAVDEAMIGFKGRFALKQYMPGKPTKWGIKAWGIADSKTGYLLDCKIYLGRKEERNKDLLLGEQVVMDMSQNYMGVWHHVYFDNFFTSTKLMKLLLEKKMYACGTARSGRKDIPNELKKPKQLKLKRGESKKLQHEDVTAVLWHDNRDVLLLSTNSDPRVDGTVKRKSGKGREEIEIPCPKSVINYTKGMGGVDISDQKRVYYNVGRPSKKWWKYLLHFVLNVSIVNSSIIYDLSHQPTRSAHGNRQLDFRKNLVKQLIGDFTSRKRAGFKRSLPTSITPPHVTHVIEKIEGRVKTCIECSASKRRTPSGRGIQTAYKCKQCNAPLCRTGCFLDYHNKRNVQIQN